MEQAGSLFYKKLLRGEGRDARHRMGKIQTSERALWIEGRPIELYQSMLHRDRYVTSHRRRN